PPWVMLAHPDAIREVFTGDPALLHAGKANVVLRPFLGRASVLLLDGAEHLRQRKLMLPPFHGARMAGYREMVAEIARQQIATWPRGEPLSLAPRMQAITLDVVLRVIFGVREGARLDALRARLRTMMDRIVGGPSLLAMVAAGPERIERYGIYKPALKPVDALLYEQIRERRAARGDDVLSLLLDARHDDGSAMTDAELRDELVTLLVAGHETTATALAWTAERLVRAPGGWAALQRRGEEYAEAAGKEALRLRPVLPVVVRHLRAPMAIAGLDLPAGTVVAPSIYLVHRRPEIYPDPARFDPERFLGDKPQGGTYTWIPFGGGVRRCLGAAFALMELRVVLAELGRTLDAAAVDAAPEPTRRRAITLVPARGAEVVLS
ncbi:MAG TPA: cytochrome P450, partial [Conexibacter sp.]|nr:cytochrome P450 [Conexibacter sp.]